MDTQLLTAAGLLRLSRNPQLHALLFQFEPQLAELTAAGAAELQSLYAGAVAAGSPRNVLDSYADRWLAELTHHCHLCFALGMLLGSHPLALMLGDPATQSSLGLADSMAGRGGADSAPAGGRG